jgi:hypothetical protein
LSQAQGLRLEGYNFAFWVNIIEILVRPAGPLLIPCCDYYAEQTAGREAETFASMIKDRLALKLANLNYASKRARQ